MASNLTDKEKMRVVQETMRQLILSCEVDGEPILSMTANGAHLVTIFSALGLFAEIIEHHLQEHEREYWSGLE